MTVLVFVPLSIESRLRVVLDLFSAVGFVLVVLGLGVLCLMISMFVRVGHGTLAPWSPTRRLVVSGAYAYVRNPMITGVLTALLGESLIFQSTRIFTWFVLFFVINNIYFSISEEPGLIARFGDEYLKYKRNVPRWIPRLKPWRPGEMEAGTPLPRSGASST